MTAIFQIVCHRTNWRHDCLVSMKHPPQFNFSLTAFGMLKISFLSTIFRGNITNSELGWRNSVTKRAAKQTKLEEKQHEHVTECNAIERWNEQLERFQYTYLRSISTVICGWLERIGPNQSNAWFDNQW